MQLAATGGQPNGFVSENGQTVWQAVSLAVPVFIGAFFYERTLNHLAPVQLPASRWAVWIFAFPQRFLICATECTAANPVFKMIGEVEMKKLLFALLLSASALVNAQVSLGIRIGPPPPLRVMRVRPAAPGPDYVFIDGYWFADGGRYRWHDGYWTRPPYGGATWVGPRHEGGMFYGGFWRRGDERFEHDHRWDRDRRVRDFGRRR